MYNIDIKFEYSPEKSELNREKHGISLEEAKELWSTPGVEIGARTVSEPRFLRIGKLKEKFYSCVYTVRGNVVRLISARRSREREEIVYQERMESDERETAKENQSE